MTRRARSRSGRPGSGRRVLTGLGLLLGMFLVVRGIAEPFVIDLKDPDSYRADWGGPSLIGVLAVHSGPALVILAVVLVWFVRRCREETG